MKKLTIVAVLFALAGCAGTKTFENIASCSLAGDELVVASMYGPVGLASKVRAADARVACAKPAASGAVP